MKKTFKFMGAAVLGAAVLFGANSCKSSSQTTEQSADQPAENVALAPAGAIVYIDMTKLMAEYQMAIDLSKEVLNMADAAAETNMVNAIVQTLTEQIKDDILDYVGTESVGKPLGVDILEQKITMPLLGAMKNAGEEETERIRKMVADIVAHPGHRDAVVDFVKKNGGIEYAVERLNEYVSEALEALNVFPDSFEKSSLVELARYTALRNM